MVHPGSAARTALAVTIALFLSGAASAETIMINRPVLSVADDETEAFLDEQIVLAAAAASTTYDGLSVGYRGFAKSLPAQKAWARVDVVAADVDGAAMLVLNATAVDGRSESLVYRMPWHDALYREIAAMIGFFHAVLGESTEAAEGDVVFSQDFQTEFIATGDLPAGTIAAASAAQGKIARLVPGLPEPLRLPTRNSVMDLAIGGDGTVFTLDMQQGFMRFGTDGTGPLDLGLPDGTYISFMAIGSSVSPATAA